MQTTRLTGGYDLRVRLRERFVNPQLLKQLAVYKIKELIKTTDKLKFYVNLRLEHMRRVRLVRIIGNLMFLFYIYEFLRHVKHDIKRVLHK